MTDITKCRGRNCDLKDKCYRYTAPKNNFKQDYNDFDLRNNKEEICSGYWENTTFKKA